MLKTSRKLKILDFDCENRPLSYWVPDMPTAEITAIASCWTDDIGSMEVLLLGELSQIEILEQFVSRYNQADIVTGHYIRRHDLPLINGALMEYGLRPLEPKMTCDTKMDLIKKYGVPATQEYLSEIFDLPLPKRHMTQKDWREANRLKEIGLIKTKERVSGDVLQHMLLRKELLKRNLLKSPKMWRA